MESKYSLVSKSKSNVAESTSFSPNLKRKFSYGLSNSTPPAKKTNLQIVPKLSNPSVKANTSQNGNSNAAQKNLVQDIQSQRQQLPVYAVRQQ